MRTHPPKACDCGTQIAFVLTRKGKHMPVDADSLSEEDVELLNRPGQSVDYRHGDHVSHFTTCPKAKEFRKR